MREETVKRAAGQALRGSDRHCGIALCLEHCRQIERDLVQPEVDRAVVMKVHGRWTVRDRGKHGIGQPASDRDRIFQLRKSVQRPLPQLAEADQGSSVFGCAALQEFGRHILVPPGTQSLSTDILTQLQKKAK